MATAILQDDFQTINGQSELNSVNERVFGEKVGLLARLFGCWHNQISRPFMDGKIAYRACLNCGARKHFNTETLRTEGRFYYPPIVKSIIIE